MGESEKVLCHHGQVMQTDSCLVCDMASRPHAPDLVVVRSMVNGRLVKRCRHCDRPAKNALHVTARKPRRAKNTNRQGANFELQVMHDLEPHGFDCLRSSGSRGKVDVVAVPPLDPYWGIEKRNPVIFIQCKITNPLISPAEREGLIDLARRAGALPVVAHRVDGKVHYRELTGTDPKAWRYWFPVWCQCGDPDCTRDADRAALEERI